MKLKKKKKKKIYSIIIYTCSYCAFREAEAQQYAYWRGGGGSLCFSTPKNQGLEKDVLVGSSYGTNDPGE